MTVEHTKSRAIVAVRIVGNDIGPNVLAVPVRARDDPWCTSGGNTRGATECP